MYLDPFAALAHAGADRFDGAKDYDKVTKTAAICSPLFRTAWRLFSCKTEAKHTKRVLVAGFLIKPDWSIPP